MTMRMLIDARHREETRVAVVKGNRIEEFDFESAEHQQLKGNIYLAKVTRVEPSLQAAFVDYGGNRHGFLAFSEIHPDYYQIPREDRERLLAEEAEAAAEEAAAREEEEEEEGTPADVIRSDVADEENSDFIEVDDDDSVDTFDQAEGEAPDLSDEDDDDSEASADAETSEDNDDNRSSNRGRRSRRGRGGRNSGSTNNNGRQGRNSAKSDSARAKRIALRRRYKIQDVIHRRQVLLVQVVKEERGNKGAALTSYLSLAGRYCVLMPNTSHGGGISRKISSASDRKRLKSIVADMALPKTMGCIVRTAGLSRTKVEIKRDFDYLARLWDEIREKTLTGAAPMLIHTDSDLIKRAIRDIYNRDIEEVIVEGDEGYKQAKDFMKLLMPSHARRVKQYADPVPLFQRYGAEDQLSAMYQPIVQLKSGGYIVINPTEALVSIDINSGRSTKEHNIEQTALHTNLEAAHEIARQLRLRDMAGLVVIDFIDMENYSNSRKVERAMKEALKNDRARIQVGKISTFGLMEMSRQRLRTGVLEASTRECPHCEGTGLVRTASSAALSALRIIEEEAACGKGSIITLSASSEAAIYVLNNKRNELGEIEVRYNVSVNILPNEESEGAKMSVQSSGPKPEHKVKFEIIQDDEPEDDEIDTDAEDEAGEDKRADNRRYDNDEETDEDGKPKRRRRRRGRRGSRGRSRTQDENGENSEDADSAEDEGENTDTDTQSPSDDTAEEKPKRTRRGRRKPRTDNREQADEASEQNAASEPDSADAETAQAAPDPVAPEATEEKPKRTRRRTKKADDVETVTTDQTEATAEAETKPKPRRRTKKVVAETAETAETVETEAKPKPRARKPRATKAKAAETATTEADVQAEAPADVSETAGSEKAAEDTGPARTGWWQRTFGA